MSALRDAPVLGFDPGGKKGFGAAVLAGKHAEATTLDSARDALAWAERACKGAAPCAAGIDALLHWSDAEGGWRPADRALRAAYPAVARSVLSPNALYGAMVMGGAALALKLKARWPGIVLNETHPKALFFALSGRPYPRADLRLGARWLAKACGLILPALTSEHALDALLSAWATREALRRGWPEIVGGREGLLFPAGEVRFYWPSRLASRMAGGSLRRAAGR